MQARASNPETPDGEPEEADCLLQATVDGGFDGPTGQTQVQQFAVGHGVQLGYGFAAFQVGEDRVDQAGDAEARSGFDLGGNGSGIESGNSHDEISILGVGCGASKTHPGEASFC